MVPGTPAGADRVHVLVMTVRRADGSYLCVEPILGTTGQGEGAATAIGTVLGKLARRFEQTPHERNRYAQAATATAAGHDLNLDVYGATLASGTTLVVRRTAPEAEPR